jgi:hypothetical protein
VEDRVGHPAERGGVQGERLGRRDVGGADPAFAGDRLRRGGLGLGGADQRGTYSLSGALLAVTAWLFDRGVLTAATQTVAWCVIFFFASAGASAAYLTVSEIFPLEVRAQVIAVFFALAQRFGALGPVLYGHLIGTGSDPFRLFIGYLIGAGAMVFGGIVELVLGIPAEGKSLEKIARPLSLVRKNVGAPPTS